LFRLDLAPYNELEGTETVLTSASKKRLPERIVATIFKAAVTGSGLKRYQDEPKNVLVTMKQMLAALVVVVCLMACGRAGSGPPTFGTPTPTIARGVSPTAILSSPPPSGTEPSTQELELVILTLPPRVEAGSQVSLHIRTANTALVTVQLYYPEARNPTILEEQRVGPEGEASWTWVVPSHTPKGAATVLVTSSVIGRSLTTNGTFIVDSRPVTTPSVR